MAHAGMVHLAVAHLAVVHFAVAHGHVLHGQRRARTQCRHRRDEAGARGQRRPGKAAAIIALRHDRIGLLRAWLHHHIVGFCHADLELVGPDGLDVQAVGLHDGHGKTGNAHVKDAHRRGIHKTQSHALARPKQAGPVFRRAMTVQQIGVGRAGDIRNVCGVHAHGAPHHPAGQGAVQALGFDVVQEIADGALLKVVVVAHLLELGEHPVRVLEGPVRQNDHVLAVKDHGITVLRLDDDGTVKALLLLQA